MTHSELLDAIQGFDVMIINGSRNPFFDNFCDSPAFYANASPDVVRNYYMKVVKNQWWS